MLKFELQKILGRPSGKAALVVLAAAILLTTFFACNVRYVDQAGQTHTGPAAARQLRQQQKTWAGVLDEAMLRQVLLTNQEVQASPEAQSEDVTQQNMAYHQMQAYEVLRDLINQAYASDFQTYDYFTIDTVTPDQAPAFYPNRVRLLQDWLAENPDRFSPAQADYLAAQYQALEAPFSVDYVTGWQQFYDYAPTVSMLTCLIACFLVAGIFSQEGTLRAEAVFFATRHGRGRGTGAKIGAGLLLLTLLYWWAFLVFAGLTLGLLGADGGSCPVQVIHWKSFYPLTLAQGGLLIALGGWLGTVVLGLITMAVSAKTGSVALAAILPFALLFLPALLLNSEHALVSQILGLLPDQLLQLNRVFTYFNLYQAGNAVAGACPLLFALYVPLALVLIPLLYQSYRRKSLR